MKPVTYFGILCTPKDEKKILAGIKAYLKTLNRTTSTVKEGSMLASDPFNIKQYHWNLNKDTGTWMDLKPNEDLENNWRFPDHKDCAWIIHVRIDLKRFPDSTQEKAESFINSLLASTGFKYIIIKEDNEL